MADQVAKLEVAAAPGAKPYGAALVGLVILGCALAMSLNVVVDPRSEFPSTAFPPLVIDRVHERMEAYDAQETPAQDLVLGTSRAGLLRGLPGREDQTFNFFLGGSVAEDWLDVYRFVKHEQGAPTNLVLVVDQPAFTDAFAPRVPISADAGRVLGAEPGFADRATRAVRSLSLDYLQDTVHSLELRFIKGYPSPPTGEPHPAFAQADLMEAYRDGTFHPSQVNPTVDTQFVRAFGSSASHVPAYAEALQALLREAVSDGVTVWAVMPPYQPVVLADLEARFPNFGEEAANVRSALVLFCPAIRVVDATKAEDAGVDVAEFFDQSHLTQKGSDQLMAAVASGRGDACPAA